VHQIEDQRLSDAATTTQEPGFDAASVELLDSAAAYQMDEQRWLLDEREPGEFWSIRCRNLHKRFGRNKVLAGVDVGFPEGMISVVLGPSGTGKSVLIKHLIGLMFPDAGEVIVHGKSLMRMTMRDLLATRRKFGILFQDGALFGSMNLYDNVAFPLRQHTDMSEEQIARVVRARLADVGLSTSETLMPNELSGGMRKRGGFARALVLEPEIVIFDEPDSGLDPVRTALLCECIKNLHREHGGTYIVITHDIASARQIGEFLVVLWNGKVVEAGGRDEMFESANPFVRQFLSRETEGPLGMD
jgi:phospholipid/cholesterol/gamma-HCH transport system ATP-binding protein